MNEKFDVNYLQLVGTEYDDWRSAVYVANKHKLWGKVVVVKNEETGKYVIKGKD